ncbi:helix-turn-helix transcriptional regulator [Flavobacterium lindanitolerans]|nr:helix-turn-helix transcriptional regulator [Flavobacterium lindanitolerans]
MSEIIKSGGLVKVAALSEKLKTNRKTLLRLFQKHLLCSVEEYKKMVRFRQAINFSQEQNGANTLTEVALFSQYYDQADFIRQFKSITKESPKKLSHPFQNWATKKPIGNWSNVPIIQLITRNQALICLT